MSPRGMACCVLSTANLLVLDSALLAQVGDTARARGEMNLAFAAYLQNGDVRSCATVLKESGCLPEAALFARTYAPSLVPELVQQWKHELEQGKSQKQKQIAKMIADPAAAPDAFPEGWADALAREAQRGTASLEHS